MALYKVTVTFSGSKEMEVEADSEEEVPDNIDWDSLTEADLDDKFVETIEEVEE